MKLTELRKLAEARTKGEWGQEALGEYDNRTLYINNGDPDYENWPTICEDNEHVEDVKFIAAFANHADAMLDALNIALMVNEDLYRAGFTLQNEKLFKALAKLEAIDG